MTDDDPQAVNSKSRLPPIRQAPKEPTTKILWASPDGSMLKQIVRDEKETLLFFHSSGGWEQWGPGGDHTSFSPNGHISYAKGGTTLSIDNNGDIKIKGHNRINVDVDAHVTFGKNFSMVVGGHTDIYSGGHTKIAATDIGLQTTAGSVVTNSARDVEVRADQGRISHHSSGVQTHTMTSGDFHVDTAGKVQTVSALNTEITTNEKLITNSTDTTYVNSQANIETTSKGDTIEKGATIQLNP